MCIDVTALMLLQFVPATLVRVGDISGVPLLPGAADQLPCPRA
jgi:hypothetical protein